MMDESLQSTSPLGAAETMQPITIVYLVLILIFAVVVIAGLWWEVRKRRERRDAETALEEEGKIRRVDRDATVPTPVHERTSEPAAPEPSASPEPAPPPATPPQPATEPAPTPPVAPPPPPIADGETVATPVPEPGPAPAPITEPRPEPAPARADTDTLTVLKGVGPKVATRLNELGITRYDQIAALDPDEAEALDAQLGNFSGRMARDRWIEQADLLCRGEREAYEAKFGKLG